MIQDHNWGPILRDETWDERVESLTARAKKLGYVRIGETGLYHDAMSQLTFEIDECDAHVLFPREKPSKAPEFHGKRVTKS